MGRKNYFKNKILMCSGPWLVHSTPIRSIPTLDVL